MALRESDIDNPRLPIGETDPIAHAMDIAVATFPITPGEKEYHISPREEEAVRTLLLAGYSPSAVPQDEIKAAQAVLAFKDLVKAIPLVQSAFTINAYLAQHPNLATTLGFFEPLDIFVGRLAHTTNLDIAFTPDRISDRLPSFLQRHGETREDLHSRVVTSYFRMQEAGHPDTLIEQLSAERQPLPFPTTPPARRRRAKVSVPAVVVIAG